VPACGRRRTATGTCRRRAVVNAVQSCAVVLSCGRCLGRPDINKGWG